jgi:uncharacterized protein involved in propanediol utilization
MTLKAPIEKGVTCRVPGTCGELVQGIYNGTLIHVTCPVDLYSYDKTETLMENIQAACKKEFMFYETSLVGGGASFVG